jgi:UMF1 family MFS transporter
LIALPIPIMYFVDVQKGRADAIALSEKDGFYAYQDVAMDDFDGEDEHASSVIGGWEDEDLDDRQR